MMPGMSTEPNNQNVKRRWRPWKVLLLTLVCIIAIYSGYRWWQQKEMNARLEAAIAATDAIDPNWRYADMVREYEKLPASIHFPQAILAWRGYLGWFGDNIGDRPGAMPFDRFGEHFGVRFPEPYFKILKERLQEPEATGLKNIKEELRLLAEEPAICRVPYEDNNLMQRVHNISHYLLDEMELAMHENRAESLAPLLQSQLHLSRFCRTMPKQSDLYLGMMIRSRALSGIIRALALGTPMSSKQLSQFQKIISHENQSDLVYFLKSLRAVSYEYLDQAENDHALQEKLKSEYLNFYRRRSPSFKDHVTYWWKWLESEGSLYSLNLAKAETLESLNDAIALAKKSPESLMQIDPATSPIYVLKNLQTVDHPLTKPIVNNVYWITKTEAVYMAQIRTLIVALACERFRLATGHWPKELNELKSEYLPEIPLDPYTGKAVLFSRKPDGVVIYSIGIDGVDQGGEVLWVNGRMQDNGVKLLNPELRGRKYEELR